MAIGFFLFPFSTLVLPIIRSYDPINQMFETFCPVSLNPKVQKCTVVALYLWSVFFGALSCLNLLLLTLTHCLALYTMASKNLSISMDYLKKCPSIKYSKNKFAIITVNNFLTIYEIRNLEKVFQQRYLRYNRFRYMITGINMGLDWYIPASLGVGIALCIASNYGLIELYGRLPKIMEACMLVTTIGFTILSLHLLLYAAGPLTHSRMLIHFWRKIKMGKVQRKQVNAIFPVGFAMGQYFSIKKRTALDIVDTILNYTVSVLMG